MPTEITTYIAATPRAGDTLTVDYFLELDEGHDRPVWQWLQPAGQKLVPSSVDQILFEGIGMLAQQISGKPANTAAAINAALADWIVGITATSESIAPKLFAALKDQGLDITVNLVRV
jgi:hypothetical protein